MAPRERRNLRPRDRLGRPLPYGSDGFEPPVWAPPTSPVEALQLAQQLLDDGLPFYAHEVLEDQWKAAPESERDLWRGMAQLAVGQTHLARGNRTGALSVIGRGARAIEPYRNEAPYGLDVAGLLTWAADPVAGSILLTSRAKYSPERRT